MSAQRINDDAKVPELRDLAADLSPKAMRLWPMLTAFSKFLTGQTLKTHGTPSNTESRYSRKTGHPIREEEEKKQEEENLVGTFLFSLLMAGALYRVTFKHELLQLTTGNVILQGRWFQIDAFKPVLNSTTSPSGRKRPERRNLQVRFPLPISTRCLFYRLALSQNLEVQTQTKPSQKPEFRLGQPLVPERLRQNQNFFHDWLSTRFAEFHKTIEESYTGGKCSPNPEHWQLSWDDVKNACQAQLLNSLPPWVVAGLSRRWMSRPSTIMDIQRVLFGEAPSLTPGVVSSPNQPKSLDSTSPPRPTPMRPAPSTLPKLLQDIYTETNQLLRTADAGQVQFQKRTLLRTVRAILRKLSPQAVAQNRSIPPQDRAVYDNARLLFEWLQALIASNRSLRTTRLYFYNMLLFIYDKFGATPIAAIQDADRLVHIVAECMQCYDNPASQSNVKKSFQSFFKFIGNNVGLPPIRWNDPELLVYHDAEDRKVFTFIDLDHLLTQIKAEVRSDDLSDIEATRLQSFFILCFYAGLRREEATILTVADFQEGPETLLWVRHSKTKAGIRVIPLNLLVPERELAILRLQHGTARTLGAGRAISTIPFLPSDTGTFAKPESFGRLASTYMKGYLHAGSAHDLRHSFATWFLVRWYLAFHPIPPTALSKEFHHRVFSDQQMHDFKKLFLGHSHCAHRNGATAVTRPLLVLQTLIGHACPEITLSVYAHSLDWIYFLHLLRSGDDHFKEAGFPASLTIPQAANLLHQTPASLYTRQENNQPVPSTPMEVVKEQMSNLGLARMRSHK